MPLLGNVRFSKGRLTMTYKEDFEDQYTEVDFRKANFHVTGQLISKSTEQRGIPKTKTGILDLLQVASAAKKLFWLDMLERETSVTWQVPYANMAINCTRCRSKYIGRKTSNNTPINETSACSCRCVC